MPSASKTSPFADAQARQVAGTQGMRLFLLSLGVLFGASLIGYVSILIMAWDKKPDLPPLPATLWLSTLLLVISSVTMQTAVVSARRGNRALLPVAMLATTALGLGFLGAQIFCWIAWARPMRDALDSTEQTFLLTSFYVLTGLHALHVIGGLVPLTVVTVRALCGRYSPEDNAGVVYTAMYWHFLDGVWLVLFMTLLIGT